MCVRMRWQQSLAFAAPLPAFVFQNVAFEASVKLVDENKTTITGYVCACAKT